MYCSHRLMPVFSLVLRGVMWVVLLVAVLLELVWRFPGPGRGTGGAPRSGAGSRRTSGAV
jgi:hypothetical protein